jgi:hypothetical protein
MLMVTHSKSLAQREVERIAAAIIDLVERTNGPVLLSELDEKVSGFSAAHGPAHEYFISHNQGETLVWEGMTEAGYKALRNVLNTRQVAIQYVSILPYLLADAMSSNENWQPFVLMPARAANLDTPTWAMRVSPKMQVMMLKKAAATEHTGYRPLTPCPVRFTADQFSF